MNKQETVQEIPIDKGQGKESVVLHIKQKLQGYWVKVKSRFKRKAVQELPDVIILEKDVLKAIHSLIIELNNTKIRVSKTHTINWNFELGSRGTKMFVFIGTVVLLIVSLGINIWLMQYKTWCDYAQTVALKEGSRTTVFEAVKREVEIRSLRRIADQKEQEYKLSKEELFKLQK